MNSIDPTQAITGVDSSMSDAERLVKTHAALIGNTLRKSLRKEPPLTTNAGITLGYFVVTHPRPRTLIVRNFCNVTAYLWQGSTQSGPSQWLTVASLSWIVFPVDVAIEAYTVTYKPGGVAATSGVCYVDLTDSILTAASGTLAV